MSQALQTLDDLIAERARPLDEQTFLFFEEREITTCSGLFESTVFEAPLLLGKQDAMAAVVMRQGCTLAHEVRIARCESRTARFRALGDLEYRDGLPKTEAQRVCKRVNMDNSLGAQIGDREAQKNALSDNQAPATEFQSIE